MENPNPNPKPNRSPMYPQIVNPNYQTTLPQPSSSSTRPSMYPTIDMHDLVDNLFPENYPTAPLNDPNSPSAPPESVEEPILTVPGAILHLIDNQYSVELATGDLVIHRLRQGDNTVAFIASVADDIQWPLTKDVAVVKLDESHYFFTFCPPKEGELDSSDEDNDDHKGKRKPKSSKEKPKEPENDVLSYGLTIASKGQEGVLKELHNVLENCSSFSVQKVEGKVEAEVLDGAVAAARELSPADLKSQKKKDAMEEKCAAYWTTLAPNVEEYSGSAAKFIAAGSGQLIKGILWCGDVTLDRLKWGDEVLRKRMSPGEKAEINPQTLKRIKRFDFIWCFRFLLKYATLVM